MKSLFVVLVCFLTFVHLPSLAKSIHLVAQVRVATDFDEVDLRKVKKQGWKIEPDEDDERIFSLKMQIDSKDLPLKRSVGPSFLEVKNTGEVRFGILIGDADAGVESSLFLPKVDGGLIDTPMFDLKCRGGDYASGSWAYDGKLTIQVRD